MPTEIELTEYDRWKRSKEGFFTKFVSNVNGLEFLFIVSLFCLFGYAMFTSESTPLKILLGFVVVVVFLFFYSKSKVKHVVTETEAKLIVEENLNNKIGHELPTGTDFDVGPWIVPIGKNWHVQITIQYPDGLIKEGKMLVSIFGGEVSGIIEQPTGFTGKVGEKDKEPFFIQKFTEVEED